MFENVEGVHSANFNYKLFFIITQQKRLKYLNIQIFKIFKISESTTQFKVWRSSDSFILYSSITSNRGALHTNHKAMNTMIMGVKKRIWYKERLKCVNTNTIRGIIDSRIMVEKIRHRRAESSVGIMYRSSGPNTASNSGGGRILKKW